jgi:hypothetical protein
MRTQRAGVFSQRIQGDAISLDADSRKPRKPLLAYEEDASRYGGECHFTKGLLGLVPNSVEGSFKELKKVIGRKRLGIRRYAFHTSGVRAVLMHYCTFLSVGIVRLLGG